MDPFKFRTKIILLALIILPVLVFWQVIHFDFVAFDDSVNVYENSLLNPVTPTNIIQFWKKPFQSLYIPVTYTVWGIITQFAPEKISPYSKAKIDPILFHAFNLILHIINGFLVFWIIMLLFSNKLAAGAGALLFAIHPVQVEPVAWITGMKDLLSGTLSLISIRYYLVMVIQPVKINLTGKQTPSGTRNAYWKSLLFFILALLTKPSAVAVPVILMAVDFLHWKRNPVQTLKQLGPWLLAVIPIIILSKSGQPSIEFRGAGDWIAPLWFRPLVALDAIVFYTGKILLPFNLAIDYGRNPGFLMGKSWIFYSILILLGISAAAFLLWKKDFRLTGTAVFIAGVFPVLGLIPFIFQVYSTVADRYMYLAMLGPAILLAGFMKKDNTFKKEVLVGILILFWAGRSYSQAGYWSDSIKLFEHSVTINPQSSYIHYNLGHTYQWRQQVDKAVTHYRIALKQNPDMSETHNNLATCLEVKGEYQEAVHHYNEILRIHPDFAGGHSNLALVLSKLQQHQEAIRHFKEAIRLAPNVPNFHYNLGISYALTSQYNLAKIEFQKTMEIQPSNQDAERALTNVKRILDQQKQ